MQNFLTILPLLFFVLLWALIYLYDEGRGLRMSAVKSAVLLFLFIEAATEFLSLFKAVSVLPVTLLWSFTDILLFAALVRKLRSLKQIGFGLKQRLADWFSLGSVQISFLLAALVYLPVLVIALVSPPNTSDSLTYHMPRVAHWIQQGSVEFFPTAILRQLYQFPLAEYAILHLQLLIGGDHFANMVQYFCFVECGITASLIVAELTGDKRAQAFAVLVAATIPMAILQGSSTQNDLVVSLFTACFFLFFIRAARESDRYDILFAGISLGLAICSKGTALAFCFAVGATVFTVYIIGFRPRDKILSFIGKTAIIVMIGFALACPQMWRNWRVFGSPVTTGKDQASNESITAGVISANLVRNYALHLGTQIESLNYHVESAAYYLLGEEIRNPASTYLHDHFHVAFSLNEDEAGNLLHVLLLSLYIPLAFFMPGVQRKNAVALASSILIGFALFCTIAKWQPWASRLHLPLFILGAPLIAALISRFGRWLMLPVGGLLFIGALQFIIVGEPRALLLPDGFVWAVDRNERYFANNPQACHSIKEAVAILKQHQNINELGLHLGTRPSDFGSGDLEYLVWILLKDDFRQPPMIRHVGVENASSHLSPDTAPPEWVISSRDENTIEGVDYEEVWKGGPYRILRMAVSEGN